MIGQQKSEHKSEVRVAGIDASLTGTGVCCLTKGVYYPVFLPEVKLRGAERLLELRRRLFKVIDDFKPELVMLEGYSYDSVGRLFEIGEWGGIIKVEMCSRGIPVESVAPKRLKRFMGVTRSDKELMLEAVKNRLKYDAGNNDNLADAAALARLAEVYLTNDTKYRSELEVVRDMRLVRTAQKNAKYTKRDGSL